MVTECPVSYVPSIPVTILMNKNKSNGSSYIICFTEGHETKKFFSRASMAYGETPMIWTKEQAQKHIPVSTVAIKTKAQRLIPLKEKTEPSNDVGFTISPR